ncbi:hypothetical protein PRIPAC_97454 [Pristionchus pacificus]|uniref:Uncharacterized protein n=1 Tax=Pristionchus pacificus TaxID=54126 RepID=A0A2A6BDA2_PRIPA|nr:hypothetical protein PRIPAC_97454 [Pristionchus pacificus]|eukprot:PDM63849.1 hypothetical protein PRIPAC_49822 [Pristionchus pacificus]
MADIIVAVAQQSTYSIGHLPIDVFFSRHFVIFPIVLLCAGLGVDTFLWDNYQKIAWMSMALFVSRVLFILRFSAQALINENAPIAVFPYFCPLFNSAMFLPYLVTLFYPICLSLNHFLTSKGKKTVSEIGWIACSTIMAVLLFTAHMYWGEPVSRLNCRSILQNQNINTGSAIVDTAIHLGAIFMCTRTLASGVSGGTFNVVFSLMIFSTVSLPMVVIPSIGVTLDPLSPWTTFIVVANDLRGEVLCAVLLMMIFTLDSRAQWTARKAWGRLFGRKKIGFEGLEVSDPLTGSTPSIA